MWLYLSQELSLKIHTLCHCLLLLLFSPWTIGFIFKNIKIFGWLHLILVLVPPPQVAEQEDHEPHGPTAQSTEIKMEFILSPSRDAFPHHKSWFLVLLKRGQEALEWVKPKGRPPLSKKCCFRHCPNYYFDVKIKGKATWWKKFQRTEGVGGVFWGRNRVLASHRPGIFFDPQLSITPAFHVHEHPPKLGTFLWITVTTECLEQKMALK